MVRKRGRVDSMSKRRLRQMQWGRGLLKFGRHRIPEFCSTVESAELNGRVEEGV